MSENRTQRERLNDALVAAIKREAVVEDLKARMKEARESR